MAEMGAKQLLQSAVQWQLSGIPDVGREWPTWGRELPGRLECYRRCPYPCGACHKAIINYYSECSV